jgi:NADPH2:quinone reductase
MRAMVIEHYGEPDVMRLRDAPVPEPQDGEVLMRVCYAGVNPSDSKAPSGAERTRGLSISRGQVSIRHRYGCRRYRGTNGIERHGIPRLSALREYFGAAVANESPCLDDASMSCYGSPLCWSVLLQEKRSHKHDEC